MMEKRLLMLLMVLAALLGTAAAAEQDIPAAQSEALELDEIQSAGEQWVPGVDLEAGMNLEAGLQSILDTGSGQVSGVVRKALRSGVLLLTVVLLCGMAEGLYSGAGGGDGPDLVSMVGAMAVAAVAVADAHSLIGMGREALEHMESFSKLLLPAVTAAAAASGAPGGAAARQLATMLFSDVLMTAITGLLLPLLYLYMAACVAHTATGNEGLKRVAATIKWGVTAALCAILLLFVSYLTLSGAIAGTADAAAVKAAKFTMSSMVPVVGGILSDAAETVLASAGILKNAVGVFGMLVVLGMCVAPFLQLGIHYLVYKLTAALSATVSAGRVSGLIDQIGGAFGLVLGMTGSCALLLLISMVSAVTASTGG
ncbi:stage III sporulation protein AE [uncultured Flavonifractor sp.]|uniref:stage III sporulation protein AE n=1 Tax=uncultured Flavonifractor sp. TaxID=1193534 RepID=UPI0026161583|nr:stage III sporulation protein AE [uncultured Flavonifractor sp.]